MRVSARRHASLLVPGLGARRRHRGDNQEGAANPAQAPGARHYDSYTGTLADIGGYSLNYHKHIHCGEGGILVTNDEQLAQRLRLLRNHAEAVIKSDDPAELNNMLGYNFRMGEIEAAIASVQLDKLAPRVESRQQAAASLTKGLEGLKGLTTPYVAEGNTHVYYVYGMTLDIDLLGVSRKVLVDALKAEGIPGLVVGYQNLHLLPMFKHKIAYGSKGFPWTSPHTTNTYEYGLGLCPVAEELHAKTFLGINLCMYEYHPDDIEKIAAAFIKVWGNLDKLKD